MSRSLVPAVLFACGGLYLSTAPATPSPAKPAQKKSDDKKKPDEQKKADPAKPEPAEPKPTVPKTADPEPEESFDPSRPTNPLDLAHGLREQGLADLAVEYLVGLGAKPLPPGLQAVLPLELAQARLDAVP